MRTIGFLAAVAVLMSAGASYAAPPSATQKAQFEKECLRNSGGNTTLCSCKTEQVMKLADAEFMELILATMNGKSLPEAQSKPYGIYISRSNAVCAPGM